MVFSLDASKHAINLKKHGIDLAACESIFDAAMLTEEDTGMHYGGKRLKSLGWFDGAVVMLVWTDRRAGPHLISCRHADKTETKKYFQPAARP